MSARELTRVEVLSRVKAGTLSLGSAATLLSVSYRQAKRLARRYRAEGAKGLKHRSAGHASNHARLPAERERALALVREKYSGPVDVRFGPTLAAEHLASEDGVTVHHDTLRRWIEAYGVPLALYTDWKNVYVREPNAEEQVTGAVPLTQFGRMCASLGIQIIAASSPQAKGRVERNHGTHQDRLVKKLRRLGIADAAAANAFLEQTYLPEHNRRFAVTPASGEDFHRR